MLEVKEVRVRNNGIKWFINEEKGIVVCKLTDCRTIPADRIIKYAPHFDLWAGTSRTSCIIHDEYTGVAKCSPEDTFDIEVGKNIALRRAKAKRAKAINQAIAQQINYVTREIEILKKHGFSCIDD